MTAVARRPVPSGLVSTRACPAWAPALVSSLPSSASPVTAWPYIGSGPSTVWPPTTAQPPSDAAAAPPASTSARTSRGRSSRGQATRFSPNRGVPPMAYTSEAALVAAMRPQVWGSSTTGAKKSAVEIRARPSPSRQAAASSPVSVPTMRSSWDWLGSERTTCASSEGPSLPAQPAPWL